MKRALGVTTVLAFLACCGVGQGQQGGVVKLDYLESKPPAEWKEEEVHGWK